MLVLPYDSARRLSLLKLASLFQVLRGNGQYFFLFPNRRSQSLHRQSKLTRGSWRAENVFIYLFTVLGRTSF
jgi:hypothetical protein